MFFFWKIISESSIIHRDQNKELPFFLNLGKTRDTSTSQILADLSLEASKGHFLLSPNRLALADLSFHLTEVLQEFSNFLFILIRSKINVRKESSQS